MKGNKLLAVCNECSGLEFVKLEQLYEHFSQAHPDIPTTSTQPGETCHYKWKTKLQLGGHTAALCCNMCSFVTTELNVFQKHVEAHDEKDKRYEYHCKIDNLCGFRCETREQLAEHKKLLHKIKYFIIILCIFVSRFPHWYDLEIDRTSFHIGHFDYKNGNKIIINIKLRICILK